MNIYLGSHASKKDLVFLLDKLSSQEHHLFSKVPLDIQTTIAPISHIIDFVFMPNQEEQALAKQLSIPYYSISYQQSLRAKGVRIYKHIFSSLLYLMLKPFTPTQDTSHLIIIKTDAIGDYILFRNFLKVLHQQYSNITLVANKAYKDLFETFDSPYVQEVFFIDPKKFVKNIFYAFSSMKKLRKQRYSLLINPIYSRDFISEEIAKNILAQQKIAPQGDTSCLPAYAKKDYDKNYTSLTPSSTDILFEFHRNLEFFRHLLDQKLTIDYHLDFKDSHQILLKFSLTNPYSILFIGASAQYRKWGMEHFAQVGKFLLDQGLHLVICGGSEDIQNANLLKELLPSYCNKILNLCGKTTLVDLVGVIHHSKHVISNETSCVHIAHALKHQNIFVISNGNHLYRFTPYPKDLGGKSIEIHHPNIQKNLDAYKMISNFLQQQNRLDINAIIPSEIIEAIKAKDHLKKG